MYESADDDDKNTETVAMAINTLKSSLLKYDNSQLAKERRWNIPAMQMINA